MAWNGSNSAHGSAPRADRTHSAQGTTRSAQGMRHGIYAGAIVVALGGAALWFFTRPAPPPTAQGTKPKAQGTIATTTPARAGTNKVVEAKAKQTVKKPVLDYAQLTAAGKMVVTNSDGEEIVLPRCRRRERPRPAYAIFAHSSENRIASLMTAEPGTRFFGTQIYDEKFKQDFLKSCEEPIVIKDDDDDYAKQLKKDMIATKIELRDRMRKGEDICKIMSETRGELQRLGIVKQQMQEMVRKEIVKSAVSEANIDDCIAAANKMLADKGIAPLNVNPVIKRTLMRSVEVNKAKKSEGEKK